MKNRVFHAQQSIFPFAEVPPVVVNTLEEFTDAVDEFGVLIGTFVASQFSGVCRTRIYNLIEEGTLQKVVVYGAIHVPLRQVLNYMARREQRKSECETCHCRAPEQSEKLFAI